jgi:hypothetical protein
VYTQKNVHGRFLLRRKILISLKIEDNFLETTSIFWGENFPSILKVFLLKFKGIKVPFYFEEKFLQIPR